MILSYFMDQLLVPYWNILYYMITNSCQTPKRNYPIVQSIIPSSRTKEVVVKIVSNVAPFNCTAERSKELSQSNAPGPGSYNLTCQKENYSRNQKGRMKIPSYELNMFKSKCKRFLDLSTTNPGPGDYNVEKIYKQKQIERRGTHKMVEYFRNQKQKKGCVRWVTPAGRSPKKHLNDHPIPQSVFASKSNREVFQQRPQSANVFGCQQNKSNQQKPKLKVLKGRLSSAIVAKKNRLSCPIEASLFDRQMKRQNNDCWVGPGYYYGNKQKIGVVKNSHSKGEFGSCAERFNELPVRKEITLSCHPGTTHQSKRTSLEQNAFVGKQVKFEASENNDVGPWQSELQNDFSYHLKSSIKKAGSIFGKSSKKLFDYSDVSPGPGDYNLFTQVISEIYGLPSRKHERLKSACSIKNLKRKEKQLQSKYYLQNKSKPYGSEETQGEITTIQLSNSKIHFK